ncbi:hypothetical protein [Lonsdalea quercina]|uniref:hypothetical protein n=1 Tax=Lonsdalea quercina TaxID=71657 RepID=UPI0039754730
MSGAAIAGPKFNVTFKHLGSSSSGDAVFSPTTSAEIFSKAYASPAPKETVKPGMADTYTISSPVNDVRSMHLRYKIGNKEYRFDIAYTVNIVLGNKIPKWIKNVTQGNAARCNMTVKAVNNSTYDSTVELTMR